MPKNVSKEKTASPGANDEKARNLKALARTTKVVQLLDICLQSSNSFVSPKGVTGVDGNRQYYADAELLEDEENNLLFFVLYHLGIRETEPTADDNPPDVLLLVEATFTLSYQLKSRDDILTDDLSVFAKINALHNVWPYWREFVQNITMRMGIPPVTLKLKAPVIAR